MLSRESTRGDSASAELQCVTRGTASDLEAKSALGDAAPVLYDGLPRESRRVSPIFVDISNPDGSIWEGAARYGRQPRAETGESEFSFDTAGSTQHISESLATAGASAAPGEDWEITFRFTASPNRRGLTVDQISGVRKRGWEYLWVRYADAEDSGVLVKRPVSAYVEQVYEYGNFGQLAIGT